MCLPVNLNDQKVLEFKEDISQFPPALETPGVIAFGRTCPDSMGVVEKDSHGNQLTCQTLPGDPSNSLIWYSEIIASSILTGIPIPKSPSPTPQISTVIEPSPSPEVSATPVEKIPEPNLKSNQEDPKATQKKIQKNLKDIATTGAVAIASALAGHAVSTQIGSSASSSQAPQSPSRQTPTSKEIYFPETESRRRRKKEFLNNSKEPKRDNFGNLRVRHRAAAKFSVFLYEVLSDGNYLRSINIRLNQLLYSIATIIGILAFFNQNENFSIPEPLFIGAFVALGLLDATAGLIAASLFALLSLPHALATSAHSVIVLITLIFIAIIPNFIGSSVRPFDRDRSAYINRRPSDEEPVNSFLWDKTTDIALGSLIAAWVGAHAIHTIEIFAYSNTSNEQLKELLTHSNNPVQATILLICVMLFRHTINSYALNQGKLKDKRKEMELDSSEIEEPSRNRTLAKITIQWALTSYLLNSFFNLLFKLETETQINNQNRWNNFFFAGSISALFILPELVKVFRGNPEARSDKFSYLNLQNSSKIVLLIGISSVIEKFDPEYAKHTLQIYLLFGLLIFFSLTEVFIKRKENPHVWHKFGLKKYLYYLFQKMMKIYLNILLIILEQL